MNKTKIYIFLSFFAVAALLLTPGCKEGENQPEESKTDILTVDSVDLKGTPLSADEIGKVDLTYALQKGDAFTFKLISITDEFQSVKTDTVQQMKLDQKISYLIDTKIEEVESDKSFEVSFTFKEIALDGKMNNESFTFNSKKSVDSTQKERYLEYLALIDNTFSARIDKYGNILEIYRTTKIADKILELRNMKDSISSEQKQYFVQDITNGALRPVVMQLFRRLPDKPVAKDSVWNFPQSPMNFQVFEVKNTHQFKLTGFEKIDDANFAIIEGGIQSLSALVPEAKANGIQMQNTGYSGSGKMFFNLSKGMFEKSRTTTTLNVNLNFKAPPGAPFKEAVRTQRTKTVNVLELVK